MKMGGLVMLLAGCILVTSATVEANPYEEGYTTYSLGEIVVSEEKSVVGDISITTEITADEIKATNSLTVAQALNFVPGIRVSTGRKNEPEISIHGFDQRKTLILIDGVPYYETNYGRLDLNQIPADIVSKIEIVKGAPSTRYGPNAEAGVINIITKQAAGKPASSADLKIGEKDRLRAALSHGQKAGVFNYWLSYTHDEFDAWKLSGDYDPVTGELVRRPGGTAEEVLENGGFRENSDARTDNLWARAGVEFGEDSELFGSFHFIDTEKGLPPSTLENRIFTSRPAFSQLARFDNYDDWGIDLSGRHKLSSRLVARGKLFYHHHIDDYVSYPDLTFTAPIATSRFKDHFLGGSVFTDYRTHDWNVLRPTLHYKADSHAERDDEYLPFAESLSRTGSVALEDEYTRIDRLGVVGGLSYDWFEVKRAERNVTDRDTGDFVEQLNLDVGDVTGEVNPMAGVTYELPGATRLFGSVAKKTRFPTLQQLFSSSSGNPDLEAEKSINYTAGVTHVLGDLARLELAFFYHDISDWISRDGPDPDNVYRNYAAVRMAGFEIDSRIYLLDDLSVSLSYMYNNAADESEGRVTGRVLNTPAHTFNHIVTYRIPRRKLRFDVSGVYGGAVYSQLPTPQNPDDEELVTDRFYYLNARAGMDVTRMLEVSLAANNLLDTDYEWEAGYPAPGRTYWLGLTLKQ